MFTHFLFYNAVIQNMIFEMFKYTKRLNTRMLETFCTI